MEAPPTQDDESAWRLAGLEVRLDALSERLGRLEATVQAAVAEEVGAAAKDLRHTISELGRRLAQDLPSELARHREAIRKEIRAALPPPPPVGTATEAPPAPATSRPAPEPPPFADVAGPADADHGAEAATGPEPAEARRGHRLRRRQG